MRSPGRSAAFVTLSAAGILLASMGTRQSVGLFVSPINSATGAGIAAISLALAVGQLAWGLVQPVAGALADRYGSARVLAAGVLLLALGAALTPFVHTTLALVLTLGLLCSLGSGAASFSVLIGAAAQRVPPAHRGKVAGIINAGGSLGQFLFALVAQALVEFVGWRAALWTLALLAAAALPLTRVVAVTTVPASGATAPRTSAWDAIRDALRDRSYLLLHAGFFTCGFHIAFLVTHLPGEVNLCGLPARVAGGSLALIGLANIAGSLLAGASTERYRSKYVLAAMYGSRALLVAWFLLAPKSAWTFYAFAIGLGLTWLATVPPTAAIVAKLFGVRHLATLFGLTLVSHQVGGFLGALLGGVVLARNGDFQWMWYADIALAVAAALINLPIREARVEPVPKPAVPPGRSRIARPAPVTTP